MTRQPSRSGRSQPVIPDVQGPPITDDNYWGALYGLSDLEGDDEVDGYDSETDDEDELAELADIPVLPLVTVPRAVVKRVHHDYKIKGRPKGQKRKPRQRFRPNLSHKRRTEDFKLAKLAEKFNELEDLRFAGVYSLQDVGERLCEFAPTINVPLKLKNGKITGETRKEIKRKAKNYNRKMQEHRGVHKRKYPDLWTAMIVVLTKTTSACSLNKPAATGIAETLIRKFEEAEPDYKELYGLQLTVPNPQWIKDVLDESKRRQILENGERSSVIDEEVIVLLGPLWPVFKDVYAKNILNGDQTCFYVGSDGKGNRVWSLQPFVGLRIPKGQLTYTFMLCTNADGSFRFTPHVYGMQFYPRWCASAQAFINKDISAAPLSLKEKCKEEAKLLCKEEEDEAEHLKASYQIINEERGEAYEAHKSSPQNSELWRETLDTWKGLVAETKAAKASYEAAAERLAEVLKEKTDELLEEQWTPPNPFAEENFHDGHVMEARLGHELKLPVVLARSPEVKQLEKDLRASENAHKSCQTKYRTEVRKLKGFNARLPKLRTTLSKLESDLFKQTSIVDCLQAGTRGIDNRQLRIDVRKEENMRDGLRKLRDRVTQRVNAWELKVSVSEEKVASLDNDKKQAWEVMSELMHRFALSDDGAAELTGPIGKMNCRYHQQDNGWMDTPTMVKWFVALARAVNCKEEPVILILDNVPFHHKAWNMARHWEETKGLTVVFLPAKSTSYTQPLDLGIIGATKKLAKALLDEFYMATQSIGGDWAKVTALHKLNYMIQAWEKLSQECIASCFGCSPVFADHKYVLPSKSVQKRIDARRAREALDGVQAVNEPVDGGDEPMEAHDEPTEAHDEPMEAHDEPMEAHDEPWSDLGDLDDSDDSDDEPDEPVDPVEEQTVSDEAAVSDQSDEHEGDSGGSLRNDQWDDFEADVAPEPSEAMQRPIMDIHHRDFGYLEIENMHALLETLSLDQILPGGTRSLLANAAARRAYLADPDRPARLEKYSKANRRVGRRRNKCLFRLGLRDTDGSDDTASEEESDPDVVVIDEDREGPESGAEGPLNPFPPGNPLRVLYQSPRAPAGQDSNDRTSEPRFLVTHLCPNGNRLPDAPDVPPLCTSECCSPSPSSPQPLVTESQPQMTPTPGYPSPLPSSNGYPSPHPSSSGYPQPQEYPQPVGYPQPEGYPQPDGYPQPQGYPTPYGGEYHLPPLYGYPSPHPSSSGHSQAPLSGHPSPYWSGYHLPYSQQLQPVPVPHYPQSSGSPTRGAQGDAPDHSDVGQPWYNQQTGLLWGREQ